MGLPLAGFVNRYTPSARPAVASGGGGANSTICGGRCPEQSTYHHTMSTCTTNFVGPSSVRFRAPPITVAPTAACCECLPGVRGGLMVRRRPPSFCGHRQILRRVGLATTRGGYVPLFEPTALEGRPGAHQWQLAGSRFAHDTNGATEDIPHGDGQRTGKPPQSEQAPVCMLHRAATGQSQSHLLAAYALTGSTPLYRNPSNNRYRPSSGLELQVHSRCKRHGHYNRQQGLG